MLKEINIGHWIAMALAFLVFVAIANSDKLNYAIDYELNVLKPTCTFEIYKQDKMSCIYDNLK